MDRVYTRNPTHTERFWKTNGWTTTESTYNNQSIPRMKNQIMDKGKYDWCRYKWKGLSGN